MAETPDRYRKLPGVAGNVVGITRLWIGRDHLLVVNSAFGFESYRRYFLREIKALIVRRSMRGKIVNWVTGSLLALFALVALGLWFASTKGAPRELMIGFAIAFGIFAAIAGLILLVNFSLGPTCHVFVQTTAGVERLGAPIRLRSARAVQRKIAPLIREAQAEHPAPIFQTGEAAPG